MRTYYCDLTRCTLKKEVRCSTNRADALKVTQRDVRKMFLGNMIGSKMVITPLSARACMCVHVRICVRACVCVHVGACRCFSVRRTLLPFFVCSAHTAASSTLKNSSVLGIPHRLPQIREQLWLYFVVPGDYLLCTAAYTSLLYTTQIKTKVCDVTRKGLTLEK